MEILNLLDNSRQWSILVSKLIQQVTNNIFLVAFCRCMLVDLDPIAILSVLAIIFRIPSVPNNRRKRTQWNSFSKDQQGKVFTACLGINLRT